MRDVFFFSGVESAQILQPHGIVIDWFKASSQSQITSKWWSQRMPWIIRGVAAVAVGGVPLHWKLVYKSNYNMYVVCVSSISADIIDYLHIIYLQANFPNYVRPPCVNKISSVNRIIAPANRSLEGYSVDGWLGPIWFAGGSPSTCACLDMFSNMPRVKH